MRDKIPNPSKYRKVGPVVKAIGLLNSKWNATQEELLRGYQNTEIDHTRGTKRNRRTKHTSLILPQEIAENRHESDYGMISHMQRTLPYAT